MGILLDPKKQYVQIDLYYVEKVRTHGNSVFHFVKSQDEMDDWQRKGYIQESDHPIKDARPNISDQTGPGMPVQSTDADADIDKVIHKIETRWRRMRWKDHNIIFSRCMKNTPLADGKMNVEMDVIQFRDMKLKTCLKWWSLKAADGTDVPVTEDNIDNLVPEVAHQLLDDFERVTELSEADAKK